MGARARLHEEAAALRHPHEDVEAAIGFPVAKVDVHVLFLEIAVRQGISPPPTTINTPEICLPHALAAQGEVRKVRKVKVKRVDLSDFSETKLIAWTEPQAFDDGSELGVQS